jgi:PadR family transcriptional regulator, regulatory protein PadR
MVLPTITRKESVILELLSGGQEKYGLEMVEASGGELKRGTVYVTLQRLEDKQFVSSRQEARPAPEVGIPRRLYQITSLGERVFAARQAADAAFSGSLIPVGG